MGAKKGGDLSQVKWRIRGRAESRTLSDSPTPPQVNSNSTGSRTGSSRASRGCHRRSPSRREPPPAPSGILLVGEKGASLRSLTSVCRKLYYAKSIRPWGGICHKIPPSDHLGWHHCPPHSPGSHLGCSEQGIKATLHLEIHWSTFRF